MVKYTKYLSFQPPENIQLPSFLCSAGPGSGRRQLLDGGLCPFALPRVLERSVALWCSPWARSVPPPHVWLQPFPQGALGVPHAMVTPSRPSGDRARKPLYLVLLRPHATPVPLPCPTNLCLPSRRNQLNSAGGGPTGAQDGFQHTDEAGPVAPGASAQVSPLLGGCGGKVRYTLMAQVGHGSSQSW